jgi:hypothetical protein
VSPRKGAIPSFRNLRTGSEEFNQNLLTPSLAVLEICCVPFVAGDHSAKAELLGGL